MIVNHRLNSFVVPFCCWPLMMKRHQQQELHGTQIWIQINKTKPNVASQTPVLIAHPSQLTQEAARSYPAYMKLNSIVTSLCLRPQVMQVVREQITRTLSSKPTSLELFKNKVNAHYISNVQVVVFGAGAVVSSHSYDQKSINMFCGRSEETYYSSVPKWCTNKAFNILFIELREWMTKLSAVMWFWLYVSLRRWADNSSSGTDVLEVKFISYGILWYPSAVWEIVISC